LSVKSAMPAGERLSGGAYLAGHAGRLELTPPGT
jgi:hypothetical protein